MAAKRVVQYRGQTIRLYEQSYSINSEAVVWEKRKPDLGLIKALIDARLASQGIEATYSPGLFMQRVGRIKRPLRRRLALWFDDVRDQIPYGWALLIAAVVGSLTTCALAWIVGRFVL